MHAFYDPASCSKGERWCSSCASAGLIRVDAGTRVAEVYARGARRARVWGWACRTLPVHLEKGQMDWQVWKYLDTGEVEFRIHAYSKRSYDPNPIIRLGLRPFGRREQLTSYMARYRG